MQPCDVCGATDVDGGGYCDRCRVYRGTHVDDGSAATMRVSPPSSGGGYYPAAQSGYEGPQPTSPAYPTVSSGPPYPAPVQYASAAWPAGPAAAQPVRRTSFAPLFMVTVMVIVLVAGAVSVAYILAGDRGGRPRADAAPAPAPAPASGAPSGTPAADCLLGNWTLTRWRFTYGDKGQFTTDSGGGNYRFGADGTGEWDFGSGVAATGTYAGKASTARITGRITFEFSTNNGTINYRNIRANTGIVVYQSDRVVAESEVVPDSDVATYTCSGDRLQTSSEGDEAELRRR